MSRSKRKRLARLAREVSELKARFFHIHHVAMAQAHAVREGTWKCIPATEGEHHG